MQAGTGEPGLGFRAFGLSGALDIAHQCDILSIRLSIPPFRLRKMSPLSDAEAKCDILSILSISHAMVAPYR